MTDCYLTPATAARSLTSNRAGKAVHPSTITRWICRGTRLSDGRKIKLRAIRQPGGWLTSEGWLSEFLDVLTRDRARVGTSPVMEERSRRAAMALAAEGF